MKKFTVLLFLLFISLLSIAQSTLTGKVTDIGHAPLEFANVLLFDAKGNTFVKGVVTDAVGHFEFSSIENGAYYITASSIGFEEFRSTTFSIVEKASQLPFEIILSEGAQALSEVTVTAEKPLFEQKIDRTVVNVQNSVTATGSTALQILERSPGISIDRINAQISMMGKQGIIVMLNGKPMQLEAEGLIQLLENMASDNIESIELITTPPASFDAEGNAGIIDIKTIKKEDEGTNGTININSSYGQRGKYGASINLNMRRKSFNLFADFSGNHDYTVDQINVSRSNVFEGQITDTEIDSYRPAFTGLYNGRIGLDYFISDKTTVGVLLAGYSRHWSMGADTETLISDNIDGNTTIETQVDEINDWLHGMVNLNFRHEFSNESQLTIDLDYLKYYDENPVSYFDQFFDGENNLINQEHVNSTKETPIEFNVAKIDWSNSINDKLKIETGIKGTISSFRNDLSLSRMTNGEPIFDPRFTDESKMDETIGAAYFSTDYKWNEKLTAKAGLRYEYYDRHLRSDNEGDLVKRSFGRFFPTLFLTYQLNEEQQIQFSYSERISRPAFNNLAPTFFFWGYNTVFAGNPRVRPTTSQTINASFKHKSLLLSVSFSDDDSPLTFLPEIIAEDNLIITNVTNMEDAKTASVSLNFPIQITDWWESRYNFSGSWTRMTPEYEGTTLIVKNTVGMANITNSFKLPKDISLEINGNISTPRRWGIPRVPMRGSINMGLQKSLGKNGRLSLNWNDMFNWGSFWKITMDQPELNINYAWRYDTEGNIFRLSYSYNFGNKDLKKVIVRQTGSEEERSRMN